MWPFRSLIALLTALLLAGAHADPAEKIAAGPLTIEVYTGARTAHLFHVVDQMSAWSEFCHAQYGRWWKTTYGQFSAKDQALLARHAEIRKRKGWGGGMEQTFYVPDELDAALKKGVAHHYLTQDEADAERKVLEHFAPRISALMEAEAASSRAFVEGLKAKQGELASFAGKAARLFGAKSLSLPVYVLANPDDHSYGGGFSNGIITVEVPRSADVFPTLLHETFHAFIDPHLPELEEACKGVDGLDSQTLNEGLAYALSPGLLHEGDSSSDPLREQVTSDIEQKKLLRDSYTRFNRYGLALRGIVRDALDDERQTLKSLLPRAIDAWRVMREISQSFAQRQLLYSIGAGWEALNERSWQLGWHLVSFTNIERQYDEVLRKMSKGDTLFILYTPDAEAAYRSIPTKYQDLLPAPMSEVTAAMGRGESLEREGTARGFHIVLLAAPTTDRLAELVRKTGLLRKPSN